MSGPALTSGALAERFAGLHPKLIDLSLGRIERLLHALGDPHTRLPPVVHVAGTNGKGSTIAFLRAFYEAAGKRVHVDTSPHLVRINERIRLAGKLVDDERLIDALDRVERVNAGAPITIFEIITAAAFELFSATPADVLLLEVGLGGRFDSTNVIDHPAATVITPVSMDHCEFLGDTVEKIAGEKAGILKRGAPAIIGEQCPAALRVIERAAMKAGAPMTIAGRDYHIHEEGGRLVFEDTRGLMDLPLPRLVGRHQYANAGLAIATIRRLEPDFPHRFVEAGVREAAWPARLQPLRPGPLVALAPPGSEIWLDGAHNDAGGKALAEAMADIEDGRPAPLMLITASLKSKDTRAFLAHFKGLAQEVMAVAIPGDHAARTPDEVAGIAREVGLNATSSGAVAQALQNLAARSWPEPPRVLIAGSLYLAGAVLAQNGEAPT
jgi:dihydrofolate synthase/folylpolyglutamate synthase